jgi:Dolichyl-phosphate-mannose-protein mannosyltransferase
MDAAIVTPPPRPPQTGAHDAPQHPRGAPRRGTSRRAWWLAPHRLLLLALLAASLLLRLWGIRQGLPYSYNSDEAFHFVPKAIGFFGHDLNPHYFLNPPGYTMLLYGVFALWFGGAQAARHAFATDPTTVFVLARVVVAVLGTVSVWLTYLAGARLLHRAVGLVAAAIVGVAFLPVFYSHLALNDVPTLAPVALSLYGSVLVLRRGRALDFAVAGVGLGLAAGTKYTGGITLVCLLAAMAGRVARDPVPVLVRRLGVGMGAALVALLIANPYAALDPSAFFSGISQQAVKAGGAEPYKLGSPGGSGIVYYLGTFTWGLGWVPALAAAAGAALLILRRCLVVAAMLVAPPLLFVIFMGLEPRFFGRWLMPVFPMVALLAGLAVTEAVRWAREALRVRGAPRALGLAPGAVALVLILGQGVASDVHVDSLLSRPYTSNLARAWMVTHIPAGTRVVIEPMVPVNWAMDVGVSLPATPTGERWWRYPTSSTTVDRFGRPLPGGRRQHVPIEQYERHLFPSLLRTYAAAGYCWVVSGSTEYARALLDPGLAPGAVAYYRALSREATVAYHVSPYAPGADPAPFNFDWSFDYYPGQYRLPGPEVRIYRLHGGRCGGG